MVQIILQTARTKAPRTILAKPAMKYLAMRRVMKPAEMQMILMSPAIMLMKPATQITPIMAMMPKMATLLVMAVMPTIIPTMAATIMTMTTQEMNPAT